METSTHTIGQRELRNDNAEIMRRVEAGESFIVTRNSRPIAQLSPYSSWDKPMASLGELQAKFRELPPVDQERWEADMRKADEMFGDDRPEDPWQR
jgi:prevent-host-death family protein